jgi:hypothetical protein
MPNPTLLRPLGLMQTLLDPLKGPLTPDRIASTISGDVTSKPIAITTADARLGATSWGSAPTPRAQAFSSQEASGILAYVETHRQEFLQAFNPPDDKSLKVSGTYHLCARLLADAGIGLKGRKIPNPFADLPYIAILDLIKANNQAPVASAKAEAMLEQKPDFLQLGPVKAWKRGTVEGLVPMLQATCQIKDLVPAKDREAVRALMPPQEFLGDPLDKALDVVPPALLYEVLRHVLAANPVPASSIQECETLAVADFTVDAQGTMSAGSLKRAAGWMRGLLMLDTPSIRYTPCRICGFPAFYGKDASEVKGRPEEGYMVGSILGGGWQPGTSASATAEVPICKCCRSEKKQAEGGVKAYGHHPVLLVNLGSEPIPEDVYAPIYNLTRCGPGGILEVSVDAVPAGGSSAFTDLSEGQREVTAAPDFSYFKTKLTWAYLALRKQGYEVAFALPGQKHPTGIFGWVPPAALTGGAALEQAEHTAHLHLLLSQFPFYGYLMTKKSDIPDQLKRQKVILATPKAGHLTVFADIIRWIDNNPIGAPRLLKPLNHFLEINGGNAMKCANLDILQEAKAWAEAAVPTFASSVDVWQKRGADTKAFREAMDAMLTVPPERRVGVAMAALSRNVSDYLNAEARAKVSEVLEGLQVRLESYAAISQCELVKLANQLAPMIKVSISYGVKFAPDQDNYCKRNTSQKP